MTGNSNALRVLSLVMGILVFVGSGTFAYAAKSCGTELQRVREQVAELKISQGQALAEREDARTQLAVAQEEVAELKAERDQLIAERDEAKAQLAAAQQEVAALTKRLEDLKPKPQRRGASVP